MTRSQPSGAPWGWQLSRVSRALYTSSMPPAPIGVRIVGTESIAENGAEPEPRRMKRGIADRRALRVMAVLGELDDQNGVLRRESDQRNDADLGVDIVRILLRPRSPQG
jgi:hypothetical protein